jgi:hypothetical protein
MMSAVAGTTPDLLTLSMLAYANRVLTPPGFDEIVKDDFASLRQMLSLRR